MPYGDRKKLLRWRKRHNRKRRMERAEQRADVIARLGHHTPISLAWPRPALTVGQAMWIAAVLDCEGCLTLGSYWNNRSKCYAFRVTMQVQMVDREVMDRLSKLCSGAVTPTRISKGNPRRKDGWVWVLHSNGLRWLLPQIREHLLIKQHRADLVLEFLTLCRRGGKRSFLDPRAQQIRSEMNRLNTRGRQPGPSCEPLVTMRKPR